MRGNEHSVECCFFDGRADFGLGEFAGTGCRSFGENGAGCNDFDEFSSTLNDATNRIAHLVGIACHAVAKFAGYA